MARLIVASVLLATTALGLKAENVAAADPDETVADVARVAGVDPQDLQAASAATEMDPRTYLIAVGEWPGLVAHSPPPSPPAALATRVACIEAKESGGANVWNARGSGAGGVLQYFPATFARGAREIGHPEYSLWVPWQARLVAAHDLEMGRRSQWAVSGC